jgi:glycosyltransferase involved in cell wall biosynthesis
MSDAAKTCIVIPCYNESLRLRQDTIVDFVGRHADIQLVFVDDGSTDDTRARLEELSAGEAALSLIAQSPNQGKAEAVRSGMNEAFERGARYSGFWDADLATPLDEIPRFVAELDDRPDLEVLFGSRVMLLGRTIERRAPRHYLGRVGATAISLTLGLPIYDSQCGAKMFRASPSTRWLFDVEILARMIQAHRAGEGPDPSRAVRELPLREWRDVAGSKVGPLDFIRSLLELITIRSSYLAR